MRKGSIIRHLITAAIFILLEIAALAMLNSSGSLQRAWFARGSHGFMKAIWGCSQKVGDYFSLGRVNDSLALENHNLRARLAEMEFAMAEAGLASPDMNIDKVKGFSYTPAHIVKISNSTQHNYMIVDKGAADGIEEGAGVITGKGAVGIIDAVSEHYSYARSFKNHEMSISARLGKEGAVGPLSWDGRSSSGATLREIPHHVEFEKGDTVYTSGYSSIFPPDIPLGITGDAKVVNGATYDIKIRLFEDFGALRYVTIVENQGRDEMKSLEGGK